MEFSPRINLTDLNDAIEKVQAEIGSVVVGQEQAIKHLLTALLADGHILMEGVPGVAKTLIAKLLAKTIDTDFSRIQFTPDLMPSDITGTSVFNIQTGRFDFKKGPVFSNIILVDEVNRAPAKAQSALFELMEEKQVTADGHTYPMADPFLIIATQNPVEHEGTYRLPEAQLDRFLFKINIGYPSADEEAEILKGHHLRKNLAGAISRIKPVITAGQLGELREKAHQVHIEPPLFQYIVDLIRQTRSHPALFLGASPRASVALMNSAKALAAINGRDFVTPDDIQELAYPVLRHRIILTPEREMEGSTPDSVVKLIIDKTEVPR